MRRIGNVTVRQADWATDASALRRVREQVFVREQRVPAELEWDGLDPQCDHVVAEMGGEAIGTGRLLPDGHSGRMAVIKAARGQGIGSALLSCLIDLAMVRGFRSIELNAQTHALPFYRRFGFVPEGDEFIEAGIPHRRMRRDLG